MNKVRVLIIDDSLLIRRILTEIFNSSPDIEVVGTAANPYIARDMIKQLNPDVLTLDIEMPEMDGITFLKNLMRLRPTPVVMISTLTERGADITLEALSLGAVDFVPKPKVDVANTLNDYAEEIIGKVKMAALANIRNFENKGLKSGDIEKIPGQLNEKPYLIKKSSTTFNKIIALGASTGGTEAIKSVVKGFPADTPAVVITQHLPLAFSESFAKHIDLVTEMTTCIPKHGQIVEAGHIYLAPGDRHMKVMKEGSRLVIHLHNGEYVNRHKPAVDVMFSSLARSVGANAIAVLLTGMGVDGAKGMREMHDAGAITVIQDERTSIVWGMPGAAYKLGCVDHIVPLHGIANKVLSLI
ncbi:protein-glutamate methylesterase/protein-glutamine glutaminase [Methylomicrobium sp. RS1]|jgi:two-component system chemotaxis response regulator CheB|uniref:protein-glutamate methylesterase/protein-glutamine glutaminase n=1 Tax=Candidatus Methylomicrobium oryzae TaxID=2802053 RepID=UPI0019229241|nr:chemotaxis response regulator protein-glutamate methylesterase [Methylomicrobium sp. RS1]MBL1265119.1 chemotaxis response regulator protein-glutamate methylesterase [Methylomicrobium sp. RS1]